VTATRSLRAVADVALGKMRTPDSDTGTNVVPYLRAANVGDGVLRLRDVKRMHFEPAELARHRLEAGDVLVTEASGSREQVGQTALYAGEVPGAAMQNTLLRLRPREGTDVRYLYWWSRFAFGSGLYAEAAQGLGIWHLGSERLQRLQVPVLPLQEQRRVVAFLEHQVGLLDEAVDGRRQQEALLLTRRAAGALAAVTGASRQGSLVDGLLPWADRTPADWPVGKITYHARLGSGHTPNRGRADWWTDCTIPWITTGEVHQLRDDRQEIITETRERISELGVQNSSAEVHPAGTVVLSRTASAGFSGVMGTEMATSQDFVTWTCEASLSPYYLLWCLRAMRPDLLGRLAMGSTHKTIYVPDIQTLRIPVPPRAEQDAAVAGIRQENARLERLVDLGRTHLALLQERKQALITAAVTGQLDVTTARGVA